MTRLRFAALALACLLLFSTCGNEVPEAPAVTASVGEYHPPETTAPDAEEVTTPPETEPEETLPPADMGQMTASEILAYSQKLCAGYSTFSRTSQTKTEIDILGEITEKVSESELLVKDGNAVFRRRGTAGEEEYHLVDSFLCFSGWIGKCRIGGMNVTSFLDMFSDHLPLGSFEEGTAEHSGNKIELKFEKLSAAGVAYLREMLSLTETAALEIDNSVMTVRTDSNGHMESAVLRLSLSVSSGEKKLMEVKISSEIRQNTIVGILDLNSPDIADHVLLSDIEAAAYYENALAALADFKANRDAFEFTDTRMTKIGSDLYSLVQNSTAEYAYASRIGLSIDKRFDTADGNVHTLLTHYNNRRAFSQMDGGNIFVDTTVNKNNLFLTIFRPFDTAFYGISACRAATVKDGRIELTLKDSALAEIASQILMTSGIAASDLHITKITRAVSYIGLAEEGRLASVGYDISLRVTADGKIYTVEQTADVTVTSHNSAKVKVIYIDVPDDEE